MKRIHSGRPTTTNYKELHYTFLRNEHRKCYVRCNLCNRDLQNVGQARLRAHRNVCNETILQQQKENTEEVTYSSDDSSYKNIEILKFEASDESLLLRLGQSDSQQYNVATNNEANSSDRNLKRKYPSSDAPTDSVDPEEVEINQAIAELIYGCNLPLNVVESYYFKKFINTIKPGYVAKIPNKKILSSSLLENIYEKHILKKSIGPEAVILVDNWSDSSNTTIACTLNVFGTPRVFLNAWEIENMNVTLEKISEIVYEAIQLAKNNYNSQVYALVSDTRNCMTDIGKLVQQTVWHSICHSYIADLLVQDLTSNILTDKVTFILKEFKHVENDIIEKGGYPIQLPSDGKWSLYKNVYQSLINNLEYLKLMTGGTTSKKIEPDVVQLLYNQSFIQEVEDYIRIIEPVCELITQIENKDCSVADAINLWLDLDLPEKFKNCLEDRKAMVFNIYGLTAYYLHPYYENSKLDKNSTEQIQLFLLKTLNTEGIEELDKFQCKQGIFEILFEKNVKPSTFWNMASTTCPNISSLAKKLLKIPASSTGLEKAFSNWDRLDNDRKNLLSFEQSKKVSHIYYQLQIEAAENSDFTGGENFK